MREKESVFFFVARSGRLHAGRLHGRFGPAAASPGTSLGSDQALGAIGGPPGELHWKMRTCVESFQFGACVCGGRGGGTSTSNRYVGSCSPSGLLVELACA